MYKLTDYESFMDEKIMDKKKMWNEESKVNYVPCLKIGFEVLKKRIKNGETLEEIMRECD